MLKQQQAIHKSPVTDKKKRRESYHRMKQIRQRMILIHLEVLVMLENNKYATYWRKK